MADSEAQAALARVHSGTQAALTDVDPVGEAALASACVETEGALALADSEAQAALADERGTVEVTALERTSECRLVVAEAANEVGGTSENPAHPLVEVEIDVRGWEESELEEFRAQAHPIDPFEQETESVVEHGQVAANDPQLSSPLASDGAGWQRVAQARSATTKQSRAEFSAFVEQVRARINIVDVIGADVELASCGSTLKGLSPFRPEKTPSFVVWPATQSWHDFSGGGGLGGDVFSYVQQRDGVGFKQALFSLADRAGIRRPEQDEASWKQDIEAAAERREIERIFTLVAAYYHRALPTMIRQEVLQKHYGFSDETIDSLKLGWASGELYHYLTEGEGVSAEMALKTGLFLAFGKGTVKDFFVGRVVFPYWRAGRVVYFIARKTDYTPANDWEKAKYKKLLTHSERYFYVSPTVANAYFYNEDAAKGEGELLITEGVTDCISAMQAEVRCISPVTTRFRAQDLPRLIELTRRAKRIVICNDAEESGAGEAGARSTAAALWAQGREVCLASLERPEGVEKIDVNELVATRGPAALRAAIALAKPYPDYLLDGIAASTSKSELDRALEPVMQALRRCSGIRTDATVDAIVKKFGIRRRVVVEQLKEMKKADKKAATEAARARPTAKPQIEVGCRQLSDIVAHAGEVVVAANERRLHAAAAGDWRNEVAPLFLRGDCLVRLSFPAEGTPMLTEVTEPAAYGVLAREADWVQPTENGFMAVFPPPTVARDLLVYPPALPAIDAVITTPVFGSTGQLLEQPGLHRGEKLWLSLDGSLQLSQLPEQPSAEQVAAARGLIFGELFVDFPFVSQSDRAHAMAALLLPFVHRMIEGCTPLHVVESPAAGSGKGLLCHLVSVVATGNVCAARTLADNDEEIRKMLTSELLSARPIILLDNADSKKTVVSAPLASVLTSEQWTDRLLCRSEMVTMPNAASWFLTGNNIKMSKDIARRSVRVRINVKKDRAWLRNKFKHKYIIAWAKSHRSELASAALMLVKAWIAAGEPHCEQRLGSFEHWSAVMGGILQVIGVEGFLANSDELYADADAESEAWREFAQAWWSERGSAPAHVLDLHQLCDKHDLLQAVRGEGSARSQQCRLGRALLSVRDRVFGSLQIVLVRNDRNRRGLYALQLVADDESPEAVERTSTQSQPAVASSMGDPDDSDPWS